MNPNETRTLWISVFSALFAVFLLYSYTQEKSENLLKKFGAKEQVVVAKEDINEMQTLDESMLDIIERPVDFIEPNALTDPEVAVGQVALAPIKAGEQILENKIIRPGPVTGLALQVTPDKRAITIPIDESRAVAKLIKPGDRIDILAALDVGTGPKQHKEVKTIFQEVIVLATGSRIVNELPRLFEEADKTSLYIRNLKGNLNFTSITVEVKPKQAQDLVYILATNPGALFMTLRHPTDNHRIKIARNSTQGSVLGNVPRSLIRKQIRAPSPPPKPAPKPKKVNSGAFRDLD